MKRFLSLLFALSLSAVSLAHALPVASHHAAGVVTASGGGGGGDGDDEGPME